MKLKNVILIDNFDSFTFNLVDFFRAKKCAVEIFRNDISPEEIAIEKYDLLVISPGPGVPKTSGNLMKIIDKFHEQIPMFGVCLGLEAIVEFFGGSLKFVTPRHGKNSPISHDGKTIFKNLPPDFPAGRYHSLAADSVPPNLEISAEFEKIPMAVRHRELPIEAVQFHPESVLSMKNNCGARIIQNVVAGNFANLK